MADDGERPGTALYESLAARPMPEGVTLTPVECLQNCESGCSVAMRGGDMRWTYVYGNFTAEDAELVHDGMVKYAATSDGLVPWRERSTHFKKNCIARIPPMETV